MLGKIILICKNNKGLTLVEVLLSIAVLGIVSILVLGLLVNGLSLVTAAGDLDTSGNTASKITENIIAKKDVTQSGTSVKITGDGSEEEIANSEIVIQDGINTDVTFNPGTANQKIYPMTGDKSTVTNHGNTTEAAIEVVIPDE